MNAGSAEAYEKIQGHSIVTLKKFGKTQNAI